MATWLDDNNSGSIATISTYESNATTFSSVIDIKSSVGGSGIHQHQQPIALISVPISSHHDNNEENSSYLPTSIMQSLVNDMKAASPLVLRLTARDVFNEKIKTVKDSKAGGDSAAAEVSTTSTVTISTTEVKQEENGAVSPVTTTVEEANAATTITESLVALEFTPEDRIPKFDERDLSIGRVLGRGAFCYVRECNLRNVGDGSGSVGSDGSNSIFVRVLGRGGSSGSNITSRAVARSGSGQTSQLFGSGASVTGGPGGGGTGPISSSLRVGSGRLMSSSRSASGSIISDTARRPRKGKYAYVVKQLSPDLVQTDKISYLKGVVDLAMETHLLSSIDHENIISIHGMASKGPFEDGYFIILEKINDTLSKKVKGWMDMDRQCKGITGVFTGSKKKILRLQTERISAAFHLALGMNYLHQRGIVFRDLKPDNVGFDYVGILKIFDFGLAREVLESDRTDDGLYRNMTACTGAIRYMSPENASGKPYNLSTDTYSFAMILWYMLALEPPFALYTEKMILDRVCERGYRPKLFSSWSTRMSALIGQCWSENPHDRPNFCTVANELKNEMAEIDPKFAQILEEESESFLDASSSGRK